MENYKVCVNNEAESKEAQDLFFELGYVWTDTKCQTQMKYTIPVIYSSFEDGDLCCDKNDVNHNHKEITLPELRDLVVLKRNSKVSQVEYDYKEISQEYKHYKKDVSNLNSIDVYRVLKLFDVKDPALQHAVKKILCAGDRGTKDKVQDIQEAIASLNRFLEMIKEDDDIPF